MYFYFKALHIIGFVAWFAGLFYLVRLFVYHVEAEAKPQPERDILTNQFNIMEWKLYRIITTPAMVITAIFGIGMLVINPVLLELTWMQLKLVCLLLLMGYHFSCKRIIRKLESGTNTLDSFNFRLFNEVPTILLVLIVLFAVIRDNLNYLYLFLGIIIFAFLLFLGARAYKRKRETAEQ